MPSDMSILKSVSEWWKIPGVHHPLAQCFQRHIAYLQIVFRERTGPESGCTKQLVYTGFLVDYCDQQFWVTAGHVINRIRQLMTDTTKQVGGAALVDGFEQCSDGIPIAICDVELLAVDDEWIDIGFIPLRSFYANSLKANSKVVFLTEDIWRLSNRISAEGYMLVGAPDHWISRTETRLSATASHCRASIPIVCAAVDRVDDLGPQNSIDDFWGHKDAFYGIINNVRDVEGHELDNIQGMSGGPIFGLIVEQSGIKYHLFAIQSSWLGKHDRHIRGTPAYAMEAALRCYISECKKLNDN